jgi:hypothetical protein
MAGEGGARTLGGAVDTDIRVVNVPDVEVSDMVEAVEVARSASQGL